VFFVYDASLGDISHIIRIENSATGHMGLLAIKLQKNLTGWTTYRCSQAGSLCWKVCTRGS